MIGRDKSAAATGSAAVLIVMIVAARGTNALMVLSPEIEKPRQMVQFTLAL
jgi:hypothetical protein